MRMLVVNPNTTASMTRKIGLAAKAAASPGTEILAVNPDEGPASIEGYFDEAMSLAGLIRTVGRHRDADAIVIACFDDTGLDAVRCMTEAPVLGIGEAAFHAAAMLSNTFSVVTTLSRSIPAIQHNLVRYGLASRCGKVRASEVPVLDLEREGSDACLKISDEIARAIETDRAEAIVLGCAGMTDLAHNLSAQHGVPVIDGVAAAVSMAEALARIGLKTSKRGGYALPIAKPGSAIA
ncbi:Asp/Glu/hydantoin racemase [Zhengella mangrovi]|uniref:Hydantoin racemase n=1 Tax=Zhengella mangrovi TaxID=1982044 RepID=A0A2G1QJI2_9HYPH|nr:aspartate/glutamate racemase family protein [Zhengella mangrovi]PHP65378.1 Asp/Glu/hydantoin racemase [Zhengella mangrovi]